jgi:hypothetical protein
MWCVKLRRAGGAHDPSRDDQSAPQFAIFTIVGSIENTINLHLQFFSYQRPIHLCKLVFGL